MNSKPQILFVDDDRDTAQAYADLAAKQTGLATIACGSSAEAISLVGENPIAVVVLDQKMPDRTGTSLYQQLKKIRPTLKAIMLSGEADRADVSESLKLGYTADVNKGDLGPLPREIFRAYALHCRDSTETITAPVLLGRRGLNIPFAPRIEYYLRTIEVLAAPAIPDSEWLLNVEINAGQQKEIDTAIRVSQEVIIETTFDASASGSTELEIVGVPNLRSKIGYEVRSRTLNRKTNKLETERRMKETISLPAEPVNPIEPAVKSRGFYTGAEMIRVRLGISKRYLPFNDENFIWIEVSVPTGRVGAKQIDILTDGTRMERLTHLS